MAAVDVNAIALALLKTRPMSSALAEPARSAAACGVIWHTLGWVRWIARLLTRTDR